MSSATFLEKLLDGIAVEWTVLGDERFVEAANAARRPVKASLRVAGETPYYGANNIQDYVDGYTHDGEYVLIAEDGSASLENYSIQYVTGKFWANNHVHVVRGKQGLNTRFLYHYLRIVDFIPYLPNKDRSKLTKGEMIKIPLPIPCPENPKKSLEIQAEIVRILDAFTALTAELTAELTARKKQYNYYRDQLLGFEDGDVEWKTLGDEEFFEVASGGTPSTGKPEYWDDGNVPWLKSESCNNEPVYSANKFITELGLKKSSAKLLQKETTLIALVGATIFKTAFLEFSAATNQNIASIKSKNAEVISDKFVFYFLTSLYDELKSEMRNYGMLNLFTLRQFKIPVPSPKEQASIVAILDKFDTLTNSISEGLPREIELRQKQYEHYRDLLFSFPRPEEVAA
ncbi:restriction endonuclease subunit S [Acidithiobacillus sp.]|uniref:restriction endonuclease subunit S n=1 Tax=Acidithiobacillus sp. TaxID=1872118 RepID=UPI002321015F|nr:restriction endonuclease subunit S [Acidithiobacillus sp.]MDA8246681.1 restriction endonuclease subunit S [Acidithiobacillus sp.]